MTANHRKKVEQIISTGEIPPVESSYEQRRAVALLKDYRDHPDSSELVRERASDAIEQFE